MDLSEKETMKQPPRNPKEKPLTNRNVLAIVVFGLIMGIGALIMFVNYKDTNIAKAQTIAFTTLVMFQMFNVYNTRSERQSIFSAQTLRNRYLHLSVLVSILLLFAVIYYQPLQKAFETVAIDFAHWAYIILVSLSVVVVFETKKLLKPLNTYGSSTSQECSKRGFHP